jgi:hypothetical protein
MSRYLPFKAIVFTVMTLMTSRVLAADSPLSTAKRLLYLGTESPLCALGDVLGDRLTFPDITPDITSNPRKIGGPTPWESKLSQDAKLDLKAAWGEKRVKELLTAWKGGWRARYSDGFHEIVKMLKDGNEGRKSEFRPSQLFFRSQFYFDWLIHPIGTLPGEDGLQHKYEDFRQKAFENGGNVEIPSTLIPVIQEGAKWDADLLYQTILTEKEVHQLSVATLLSVGPRVLMDSPVQAYLGLDEDRVRAIQRAALPNPSLALKRAYNERQEARQAALKGVKVGINQKEEDLIKDDKNYQEAVAKHKEFAAPFNESYEARLAREFMSLSRGRNQKFLKRLNNLVGEFPLERLLSVRSSDAGKIRRPFVFVAPKK